jgi:prepilin-type processing-associated H-X9-DG protein/prepilin-type N-terminal cleavage/methylation domain-containing protein
MLVNHNYIRLPLRSGFTLIELFVVISIVTVVIGLLLSTMQRVREAANCMTCKNNLKQLALAAHNHHDVKGKFPCGFHLDSACWESELLPYVEQQNLQEQLLDSQGNGVGGRGASAQVIKLLVCPSDPLPEPVQKCAACGEFFGVGCYGGNAGRRSFSGDKETRDGIFFTDSKIRVRDVTDGASNTFLFGERSHRDKTFDRAALYYGSNFYPLQGLGKWANYCYPAHHLLGTVVPINYKTPPGPYSIEAPGGGILPPEVGDRIDAFGSSHLGGANFAYVDGSVRFLSDQTNLATLQALSTRAGREMVDDGP